MRNSDYSHPLKDSTVTESPSSPRLQFKLGAVLRMLLWAGLIVPWTSALLTPIPPKTVTAVGGVNAAFLIGKTLHLSVYATLGLLTAWLPLQRRWRILLVALLVLHGGSTEYLQQFVNRGSSPRDAVLDSIGIGLGCLLACAGGGSLATRLENFRRNNSIRDAAGEHR